MKEEDADADADADVDVEEEEEEATCGKEIVNGYKSPAIAVPRFTSAPCKRTFIGNSHTN